MIDLIDIKNDHVLGVRVTEEISSRDISLGMSFIEEKIRTRDNIALYLEVDELRGIEPDALMTEIRHSVSQLTDLSHIQRVALVTDRDPMPNGRGAEGLIPMVDVKTFSRAEKEEARAWAEEPFKV